MLENNSSTIKHMNPDYTKLDNPAWYSLSETHQEFVVDYNTIKFYHPDYCPFGGFITTENISKSIDAYSELADTFFIVGEKPQFSNRLELKKELICLQMILNNRLDIEITETIVPLTTNEHIDALFELVNLVQPGYFKRKTALLGNYSGIFKGNKLIAVTGERMKMNDFTEVSAIVTHPDHTGKGYAKQLIAHAVNTIFDQNKIPYLHVVESNIGAIKLYEKLGFATRRKMSLWPISK